MPTHITFETAIPSEMVLATALKMSSQYKKISKSHTFEYFLKSACWTKLH